MERTDFFRELARAHPATTRSTRARERPVREAEVTKASAVYACAAGIRRSIFELASFLQANREEYLDLNRYLRRGGSSSLSEAQRDDIDAEAQVGLRVSYAYLESTPM